MKPKKTPQEKRQRDLFRAALSDIIDPSHGLVKFIIDGFISLSALYLTQAIVVQK